MESLLTDIADARWEVSYDGRSNLASMVASGLKGETGVTIDATVMLLDVGEARGGGWFAAIGEGVLSVTEE